MFNLSNIERKIELAKTCQKMNLLPYEDNADWVTVADILNWSEYSKPENYRSMWKHTRKQVEDRGYSMREFVEWACEQVIYTVADLELVDNIQYESKLVDSEPFATNFTVLTPFEEFIESTGINTEEYEVAKGKTWMSGGLPSFSASFQRRQVPTEQKLAKVIERLKGETYPTIQCSYPDTNGYLANVGIYDVHLQKVAFDGSGMKSTVDLYKQVANDLAWQLQNHPVPIRQIVFPVGNDLSNTDNALNTTTAGTPQQNSVPYRVAMDEMVDLIIWATDLFSNVAPVHIPIVPGNHDEQTMYWLGVALEQRYRNSNHITVDNTHAFVKYYHWEKIGLMFVHGQNEKPKDMRSMFSTEAPLIWGHTEYREGNGGHFHGLREMVHIENEDRGFVIVYNRALSGTDEWHKKKTFTENWRGGSVRLYSENRPRAVLHSII